MLKLMQTPKAPETLPKARLDLGSCFLLLLVGFLLFAELDPICCKETQGRYRGLGPLHTVEHRDLSLLHTKAEIIGHKTFMHDAPNHGDRDDESCYS